MAVTPASLLDPFGPILPEWFPAEDSAALTARLQHYIDEAVARPEYEHADYPDAAVVRWVEYRVYSRLGLGTVAASGLKSVTLADQGSFTMAEGGGAQSLWTRNAAMALKNWRLLTAAPDLTTRYKRDPYAIWQAPDEATEGES